MENTITQMPKYRGYVFVNSALSSIQKGIQGAHAVAELLKPAGPVDESESYKTAINWVRYHKTLIFLDGGFHASLNENYTVFFELCHKLDLPHAKFNEDKDTLNRTTTAFAGIIPNTVFDIGEDVMLQYDGNDDYVKLLKRTGSWTEIDEVLEAKCRLNNFIRQFRLAA
jgi:TPP-dependent 2-oxoacid decarboxylase